MDTLHIGMRMLYISGMSPSNLKSRICYKIGTASLQLSTLILRVVCFQIFYYYFQMPNTVKASQNNNNVKVKNMPY